MKENVSCLIEKTIRNLVESGRLPVLEKVEVIVEFTRDKKHGDLASNIALTLSKSCRMNPRDLASLILQNIPTTSFLDHCEVAGAGFINFFLSKDALSKILLEIIDKKERFGCNNEGKSAPILIEFVSANPTGPLHVGHGRGAAIGDSICRLMRANGWNVQSEFYYNDSGQQIRNLALSVQARCLGIDPQNPDWPDDGYCGEYINEVARAYLDGETLEAKDKSITGAKDPELLDEIQEFAVTYLRREQDRDLANFSVNFDSFFLESSLYSSGEVERIVEEIIDSGYTYEKDGALWLKTTQFGDDKDRVMRKQDGAFTYFVPDIAYHINKWGRGFKNALNEQGADHHGTITRVRAGLQTLQKNIPEKWPNYLLHQMVTVVRNGEEVKISKRKGEYLTLSELVNEVGSDATRYFLVARAPNSQLIFDIDLAMSASNDNPVFYIQYAHARISSVLRKMTELDSDWMKKMNLSNSKLILEEEEHLIMQHLMKFPEIIKQAAQQYEPHTIANYLRELAGEFHSYYNSYKVLVEDEELREARIMLSMGVRQVLSNGLNILGVSAPEEM